MSRNGGSTILVATVASATTIGFVITLNPYGINATTRSLAEALAPGLNPVIKPISLIPGKIREGASPAIKYIQKEKQLFIAYLQNHSSPDPRPKVEPNQPNQEHTTPDTNQKPTTLDTSNPPSKTNRNYPNSLLSIPECQHLENEEVDIFQSCKDIYNESLSVVKIEIFHTNNQASQEILEQVSRKAAEKKRQELLITKRVVVTTGTTLAIASFAVADSANQQRNQ